MSPRPPSVRWLLLACTAALAPACGSSGDTAGNLYGAGGTTSAADSGAGGSSTGGAPAGPRCGDAQVDPGEACDDGNDNRFDGCLPDCRSIVPLSPSDGSWKRFEIAGTQCLDGSVASFHLNTRAGSDKLLIYLEGGGACFTDACDLTALNIDAPFSDGIFSRLDPLNPVRDWNMIYVPYCSGDIYAGDNDVSLGGTLRHFHGFTNITRFLEHWVPTFANASTVLVTGISAGGFGAGLNVDQVAQAFGPGKDVVLIDDSGPPLSNQVIPPCLQTEMRQLWGLDRTILAACGADCPDPTNFARGWLSHLAIKYPSSKVGMFSNTQDAVIRLFMGEGWGNGQWDNCSGTITSVPGSVYEADLLDLRAQFGARASFYFAGLLSSTLGVGHTVLRGPSYATTIVGGVSVEQWVGNVIAGTTQQIGP